MTGTAANPNPWEFWVDNYGAVGNGSTDDTSAINSAVSAATTYALAHNYYAAVCFSDKTYAVSGALRTDRSGYAQIPLPIIALNVPSVTLAFLGAVPYAAANPYFHQTGKGVGGTVIKSTLTGQAYSVSLGTPSVIGGPTFEQGYGYNSGGFSAVQFNNMLVIMDGITVSTQFEGGAGTMSAVDLSGVSKAHIQSLACLADATISQFQNTANKPVNNWQVGLWMPGDENNDNCYIGTLSVYGFYTALYATEHTNCQRLLAIYCFEGIRIDARGWHGVTIQNASVEAVQIVLMTTSSSGSGGLHPVNIGHLSCESIGYYNGDAGIYVSDPNNELGGIINLVPATGASSGGTVNLTGAGNLTINNLLTRKI